MAETPKTNPTIPEANPEIALISDNPVNPEINSPRPEIRVQDYGWASIAWCSDVGLVRSQNDDRVLVKPWPKRESEAALELESEPEALLLVVADGLGGSQSGGLAAEIACATFAQLLESPLPSSPRARYEALMERFYAADQEILQRGGQSFQTLGMGCTAMVAIVTPQDYIHLYAGDSRLYHLRQGQTLYRSRDHSIIQLLLESGRITPDQIPTHPMRSIVNSCLGGQRSSEHFAVDPKWDEAEPPIIQLKVQDWLILSTDGFHGTLPDEVFGAASVGQSPQQFVQHLGQSALERGGKDNLSAIALTLTAPLPST